MRIESKDQFEALRTQAFEIEESRTQQVLVCCGTGCLASGAKEVAETFAAEIAKRSIDASVELFVKSTGWSQTPPGCVTSGATNTKGVRVASSHRANFRQCCFSPRCQP